jgi:large subunit ribosomal protein L10
MSGKKETHVSEEKKRKVKELAEQMKKKTVMIVSVKGLPSAQFQDIKKKVRSTMKIQVAKKSTIDFALDHSGIKELHELVPFVQEGTAVLFSNEDAFEVAGVLADQKSPAKAKAGQIAPEDLVVKAGPTDLIPGPDISALSSVGIKPKVEGGKIAIMMDHVLCKTGEVISDQKAAILAKLGIVPFKIGLEPVAAYMNGKVYTGIKIDKPAMIAELESAYGRALPFAVEIGYVNDLTLDFLLARAKAHEGVINRIMTGEPEPVAVVAATSTQTQEETKPEGPKAESAEGLASLFG